MISKLNILRGIGITLSIAFQFLLVRKFGVNIQTDVYYLSIGTIQFISLVFSGYFLELFIPIYNDIKIINKSDIKVFVGCMLLILIFCGGILSFFIYQLAPLMVDLVAPGFDGEKKDMTISFLRILSAYILFFPIIRLAGEVLNSNLIFSVIFYINLIAPSLNIVSLLIFGNKFGLTAIVISTTIGSLISLLILLPGLLKSSGFNGLTKVYKNWVITLLRKNFVAKTGNLIFLLHGPIILAVLSYFSSGFLTFYSYTRRILEILFSVSNAASNRILYVKSSFYITRGMIGPLKNYLEVTIKGNLILIFVLSCSTVVIFEKVLHVLFVNSLTSDQIESMFKLFLAFIPFYWIHAFRLPVQFVVLALKDGREIVKNNFMFFLILVVTIYFGLEKFGIFVFPLGLMLGNLYCAMVLTKRLKKTLKFHAIRINSIVIINVVLGVLFLFINFLIQAISIEVTLMKISFLTMWFLVNKNDIKFVYNFITKKGEIQ